MSQYKEISSRSWRLASATPCSWAYNPTSHPWRGISLSRAELDPGECDNRRREAGWQLGAVCDGMQCHASNCALQEHVARMLLRQRDDLPTQLSSNELGSCSTSQSTIWTCVRHAMSCASSVAVQSSVSARATARRKSTKVRYPPGPLGAQLSQ